MTDAKRSNYASYYLVIKAGSEREAYRLRELFTDFLTTVSEPQVWASPHARISQFASQELGLHPIAGSGIPAAGHRNLARSGGTTESWLGRIKDNGWAIKIAPQLTREEWTELSARTGEAWDSDKSEFSVSRLLQLVQELFPDSVTELWDSTSYVHKPQDRT